MSSDLISVAMPCYNAAASLPTALASLLAQTYANWECIIVDDGSHDDPSHVVEQFADPRIHYVRLPTHQGTAVARQVALDRARGAYLCMLDADDWYYPWKLARQLKLMAQDARLALVSTGVAIVDPAGDLAGVRLYGPGREPPPLLGPWQGLARPPVSHAPSMIRIDAARAVGYRDNLQRSEDTDFLLNILWNHQYTILPEALYAYAEHTSATREKILRSYHYRMRVLWLHRRRDPRQAAIYLARAWLTQTLYRLAFSVNRAERLIVRRSQPATAAQIEQFRQAKAQVDVLVVASGFAPVGLA